MIVDADTSLPEDEGQSNVCSCDSKGKYCDDEHCINFSTQIECNPEYCGANCRNQRFAKQQYKKIEVKETPGKGHGLFTKEVIRADEFIMQYCGEIICTKTMDERAKNTVNATHLYLQNLSPNVYLDARFKGNITRFTNHSCEPNITQERWISNGKMVVGIFAMRDIDPDEELCFDYGWTLNRRKPTVCRCNTSSCRGYLELLSEEEKVMFKQKTGLWRNAKECLMEAEKEIMANKSAKANRSDKEQGGRGDIDMPIEELMEEKPLDFGNWLVGKRIKIYWDGNHRFWECDVMSFDNKKNIHVCYYIYDAVTQNEKLLLTDAGSTLGYKLVEIDDERNRWQWLDESRQPLVIAKKKKVVNEDADMELVDSSASVDNVTIYRNIAVAAGSQGSDGRPNSPRTPSTRLEVSLPLSAARIIVKKLDPNYVFDAQGRDIKAIWNMSVRYLQTQSCKLSVELAAKDERVNSLFNGKADRGIRVLLPGQLNEHATQQTLVLIGIEEIVSQINTIVVQSVAESDTVIANQAEARHREIHSQQGVGMTFDWRIPMTKQSVPTHGKTEYGKDGSPRGNDIIVGIGVQLAPTSPEYSLLLRMMHKLMGDSEGAHSVNTSTLTVGTGNGANTDNYLDSLNPPYTATQGRLLATMENYQSILYNSNDNGNGLSRSVKNQLTMTGVMQKTMIKHLGTLTESLELDLPTTVHALILLVRYIHFKEMKEDIVRDPVGSIAACVLLTLKARNLFKAKKFKEVVAGAYNVVYKRGNDNDGSIVNIDMAEGVVNREEDVYSVLRRDVYVPDINSLLTVNFEKIYAAKNPSHTFTIAIDRHNDFHALCGSTLKSGELCILFLANYPNLWQMFPLDVVYTVCLYVEECCREAITSTLSGVDPPAVPSWYILSIWYTLTHNIQMQLKYIIRAVEDVCAIIIELEAEQKPIWFLDCMDALKKKWQVPSVSKETEQDQWKALVTSVRTMTSQWVISGVLTEYTFGASGGVDGKSLTGSHVMDEGVSIAGEKLRLRLPLCSRGEKGIMTPNVPGLDEFRPMSAASIPQSNASMAASGNLMYAGSASSPISAVNGTTTNGLSSSYGKESPLTTTSSGTAVNGSIALSKELYRVVVSENAFSQGYAQHAFSYLKDQERALLAVPTNSTNSNDVFSVTQTDAVVLSMRQWPYSKEKAKEIKHYKGVELPSCGVSASAVHELVMLQHVHYFGFLLGKMKTAPSNLTATPSRFSGGEKASASGRSSSYSIDKGTFGCPHITPVLGVASLPDYAALPSFSNTHCKSISVERQQQATSNSKNGSSSKSNDTMEFTSSQDDETEIDQNSLIRDLTIEAKVAMQHGMVWNGSNGVKSFLMLPQQCVNLQAILPKLQVTASASTPKKGHSKATTRTSIISPSFALALIRDLYSGIDFLSDCGIAFRHLALDQLTITASGTLQICGLYGAQFVCHSSSTCTSPQANPQPETNGNNANKRAKHDDDRGRSNSKDTGREQSRSRDRKSSGGFKGLSKDSTLPFMATMAPEVIFGDMPNVYSNIYIAAVLSCFLLAGKSIVKTGNDIESHVQNMYKALGTPRKENYESFKLLPRAEDYGKYILQDTNPPQKADSRNRILKLLRTQLPDIVLSTLSNITNSSGVGSSTDVNSDNGLVLDVIHSSMQLVPDKRVALSEVLTFQLFTRPDAVKCFTVQERLVQLKMMLGKLGKMEA